jgi:hypothetical protein
LKFVLCKDFIYIILNLVYHEYVNFEFHFVRTCNFPNL